MVYVLADPALRDLLHRRPRTLSLPTGHAPIASGGSNSCRVGYLPPTGSTCPFHGARFLRASRHSVSRAFPGGFFFYVRISRNAKPTAHGCQNEEGPDRVISLWPSWSSV